MYLVVCLCLFDIFEFFAILRYKCGKLILNDLFKFVFIIVKKNFLLIKNLKS